jgi:GH35 family endo-1,4-beta-xylanase
VEPTQGVVDWSGGDRLVQFAQQNGQLVRGYTLVWHNQLPTWLTTGVANGTISNDQRFASVGLKVALTQVDVRTFVNNATQQQATNRLAVFAQSYYYDQMLKACFPVRACISFTVAGFGDADSWVPGFFKGEGAAAIYDVNLQPKPEYTVLQQDVSLADHGAPHRTGRGASNDDT